MGNPVVLLIAYHFPPDNAIGGARPYRFYKYLKRRGYICHVLTAARQEVGAAADIHYVPDPLRIRPRKGIAWQAERVSWKFLLRGELALGWSVAVFEAGRAFLNGTKEENVTIISSAPPVGTHLAAMRLAACSGRPWVADFRDPIHSTAGELAPLQKAVAPALERRIIKSADLVLANTDGMQERWHSRYPCDAEKIHLLWNGFDPEDAIGTYALPERETKLLSHVGELYGGRDIRPILYAAARLIESGALPAGRLLIRQIGAAEQSELPDAEFVQAAKTKGWLEVREPVPARDARLIALDSDGLLLIQPHTAVQVPGKLFEYLRMGRPILAYVVRDSPVERILQRAGVPYECVYPEHSPQEMEQRFLDFMTMLNNQAVGPSQWFEDTFEASRQIGTLDTLIRSLSGDVVAVAGKPGV